MAMTPKDDRKGTKTKAIAIQAPFSPEIIAISKRRLRYASADELFKVSFQLGLGFNVLK